MNREEHDKIAKLISTGFLAEDLAPLMCTKCDSTELEDMTTSTDGGFVSEFQRSCSACGAMAGYWAYGGWQL